MVRLDRKEYRCTHCGAITVISDDDADRLEQMLTKVLNRTDTSGGTTVLLPGANRVGGMIGLGIFVAMLLFGLVSSFLTRHSRSGRTSSATAEDTTVPTSQLVLSSLQWIPESTIGGNYVGLLYNHSGYTVDAPDYKMTMFHNGMKGDTAVFSGFLRTLQPGEYERVVFRVLDGSMPSRYEIENPDSIYRSTAELAPAKLLNPQFVHQQGSQRYNLIGIVQNTFTRPISGTGELLLYDKDQQIIGAAQDSFHNIRPGEKTLVSMDAWTQKNDVPIAAYEYLIDAQFTDSR